jgi:hypothetical protein
MMIILLEMNDKCKSDESPISQELGSSLNYKREAKRAWKSRKSGMTMN